MEGLGFCAIVLRIPPKRRRERAFSSRRGAQVVVEDDGRRSRDFGMGERWDVGEERRGRLAPGEADWEALRLVVGDC